jgi:phenylacetate-coenzyme A ligase PaaK-like adenylate-forming protein
VIVGGYAGVIALLVGEQEAGGLRIHPVLIQPTSEGLTMGAYARIAQAFHAEVRANYVTTECLFIAYGCAHGWLHVNSDWFVLEPVDAENRPVPPGEQSSTVLLSNLANRVQPILRYDLGDSIVVRPDRCPCGDPTPRDPRRGPRH